VRTWETIWELLETITASVLAVAMTYRGSSGGEEDQRAEVGGALVGKSTSGVDQSTNTVCLDGRADDGATPGGGSGRGFLAVEVLLLGVGLLRAAVGVTEDGAEDGERDGVVEGRAKSDGRGLDGWEVWRCAVSNCLCFDEIVLYDAAPARKCSIITCMEKTYS